MAHFYAFDHHYGQNIRDEHGMRIGRVVVFDHKRDRDVYCHEEDAEPHLHASRSQTAPGRDSRS